MNLRAGETAQATKWRLEDFSSDLQHSHERPGGKAERGENLSSLAARLAELVSSRLSKRLCLKRIRWVVTKEDNGHWPLASAQRCEYSQRQFTE